MAIHALAGWLVWLLVIVGLRNAIHRRRTGASGIVFARPQPTNARERLVTRTMLLATALGPLAACSELAGLAPWWDTSRTEARALALALFVVALLGTFACQLAMRDSWRIGLDLERRTALVTDGPYRFVRNPIYVCVFCASFALVAAVPNALAVAQLVATVVGFEWMVRWFEEPFLLEQHGAAYREYAARTGRFVPGLGRLLNTSAR